VMIGLLGCIRHLIHKFHGGFEIRKAKYPLNSDAIFLPSIQRGEGLLNFCVSKNTHASTFLGLWDFSVFAEKLQLMQKRNREVRSAKMVYVVRVEDGVRTGTGLMG